MILIICEQRDGILHKVSLELIGKARELATDNRVVALLLGHKIEGLARTLVDHGADKVIFADDEILAQYMTEPYAKAACAAIRQENPEIVLIGATYIGRDLGPRIAARIKTGLTADCTFLEIDAETGELLMTRPAFGGNLMATIVCPNHRPQMATVRPGVMLAAEPAARNGEVARLDISFEAADANIEILETTKISKEAVDITKANVLISGGRGMGGDFSDLRRLAEILGGELAASRAAVDAGHAEKAAQVGQTGKTVRPDLYIAAGISGAVQHTAGMEESALTIAINKDPAAPIFDVADIGIVGNVARIVPKLNAGLLEVISNR
ncbi:MAG: electron transfer flavoprotein subunit alpha/FixB family protein [Clostridiales bacterium]|jgi:electron transfer flavoprotein alpha subunit|nr:electron transfer flavoprotein subunit alpha/FixB family protein [Clostridiales bacterium]